MSPHPAARMKPHVTTATQAIAATEMPNPTSIAAPSLPKG